MNYPKQEGTFFGNIIETGDLSGMGMSGVTGPVAYYCEGAGFADGTVQGRLGAGQSGANLPYKNPYGGKCNGNQNFVGQWSGGSGGGQPADGYKTAMVNGYTFQNGEPITVWRNPNTSSGGTTSTTITFNPAYAYRLMPKHVSGKSVDFAYGSTNNGTAVQQWASNTNTAQKFAILASGSNWKLAMTINTNKCVGPVATAPETRPRPRSRTATAATTRPGSRRWSLAPPTRSTSRTWRRTAAWMSPASARRTAPACRSMTAAAATTRSSQIATN